MAADSGEPGRRNGALHMPREGASTSGEEPAGEHVLLSLQLKRGKVRGGESVPLHLCAKGHAFKWTSMPATRMHACQQVRALLWVCSETWRPQRLSCPLCGQLEVSEYSGWRLWQASPG